MTTLDAGVNAYVDLPAFTLAFLVGWANGLSPLQAVLRAATSNLLEATMPLAR